MARIAQNKRQPSWFRDRLANKLLALPRPSAIALFFCILAIAVVSSLLVERNQRSKHEDLIRQASQSVAAELERKASTHLAFLKAGSALFTVLDKVDEATFTQFAGGLTRADTRTGSSGIGWAELITAQEVDAFEARHSAHSGGPITVSSRGLGSAAVSQAEMLLPVTFFEPATKESLRRGGFDLYSDAALREAIIIAARTGEPVASGRWQNGNPQKNAGPGFLILMPVFERFDAGGIGEASLKGFVFVPFDAAEALTEVLEGAAPSSPLQKLNVQLYDGDPLPENLLALHEGVNVGGASSKETFMVANRTFTVAAHSAYDDNISLLALKTLLLGLAIASLLALLIYFLTQKAVADKAALEQLEQQSSIRSSLTRELNHRAKNTLANVLSIISLTRRRSTDLDQFADALDGRVRALTATHDLLTRSDWSTTPLRSILETELRSLIEAREGAVHLSGPDTSLAPNDALSFGLAVHELATNAARFGSLSVPEGRLSVSWRREGRDVAIVEWREEGGPAVPQERVAGFGTDLIEKVVAHELKGPVDLQFHPDGVRCILHIPVRERADFAIRQNPSISRL